MGRLRSVVDMTKFEKFAEFIMESLVYPLVLTFIALVAPAAIYFITGVELMWLVNTGGVLACITAVWLAISSTLLVPLLYMR